MAWCLGVWLFLNNLLVNARISRFKKGMHRPGLSNPKNDFLDIRTRVVG